MENIHNIYCVGRNYVEHVKELNNEIPESPIIFSKPTHSLVHVNGQEVELPKNKGEVHYEVELVIQLAKDYDENESINDMVKTMYMGIDLTLRDAQQSLKDKGYPWLLAKGFKNAAILSSPFPYPGTDKLDKIPFSLKINGNTVQVGKAEQMMFDLDMLVHYIGENLGLKAGDIIYTGTPSGVGALRDGDELSMHFNDNAVGSCLISFI